MSPALPWNPYARLSPTQHDQLRQFKELLLSYNPKINLVSRETEAHFEERHLLHSLAITWRRFPSGSNVVDWGTGGGLPVVPLAICFPDVRFFAVDAVEKKLRVVQTVARRLGLQNLDTWHGRAEAWPGRAVYAVSRATAPLVDLWSWSERIYTGNEPALEDAKDPEVWKSGLITLKGGDLTAEVDALKQVYPDVRVESWPLQPLLRSSYFRQKSMMHVSK